jgi:hypothetical protein
MQATPFFVVDKHRHVHPVHSYNVDSVLRDIPADKLAEAGKYLAVTVVQDNSGEYHIKAHVRGLGGGPIGAQIGYWGAKTLVWGAWTAHAFVAGPGAATDIPLFMELDAASSTLATGLGLVFIPF